MLDIHNRSQIFETGRQGQIPYFALFNSLLDVAPKILKLFSSIKLHTSDIKRLKFYKVVVLCYKHYNFVFCI